MTVKPSDMSKGRLIRRYAKCAIQRIFLAAAVYAVSSSNALSDLYSTLSDPDKSYVKLTCMPLHFQQTAFDYRNCVESLSTRLTNSSNTPLTTLRFDEQRAIQHSCQIRGPVNSTAYRNCANDQVFALQSAVTPDMSLIRDDELYVLRATCKQEGLQGVLRYRQCINQQVASLNALSTPDFSTLALHERAALESHCSAQASKAASYRACLLSDDVRSEILSALASTNTDRNAEDLSSVNKLQASTTSSSQSQAELFPSSNAPGLEDPLNTSALASNDSSQSAIVRTRGIPTSPDITKTNTVVSVTTTNTNSIATEDQSIIAAAKVLTQTADLQRREDDGNQSMAIKVSENAEPGPVKETLEAIANISTEVRANTATDTASPQTGIPVLGAANDADVVETGDAGDLDDNSGAGKPPLEVAKDTAKELWSQLQSTLSGLTGIHKVIVMAALALPFILIVFWLLVRGSSKQEAELDASLAASSSLVDKVRADHSTFDSTSEGPGDHTAAHHRRITDQVDELFAGDDSDIAVAQNADRFDLDNSRANKGLGSDSDHYAPLHKADDFASNPVDEKHDYGQRHNDPKSTALTDSSIERNFSSSFEDRPTQIIPRTWLSKYNSEEQLTLSVEFLIYWMAYTDERYEPEMKQQLFALNDPDDHEQVKKRALNRDTRAYSETVSWVQNNTSPEQREQILKLLMALLVNEGAVTPVQNTMLRFLSNAFGLSHDDLENLFHAAFGHSLPPMPRPDKPSWWDKQPLDIYKRWDARSVAQQTQTIQSRVKLGLPLTGSLNQREIDSRFQRAMERCRLEHFDLLTNMERELAENQSQKFRNARDILSEIAV